VTSLRAPYSGASDILKLKLGQRSQTNSEHAISLEEGISISSPVTQPRRFGQDCDLLILQRCIVKLLSNREFGRMCIGPIIASDTLYAMGISMMRFDYASFVLKGKKYKKRWHHQKVQNNSPQV
jgi:hypothetical protein